MLPCACAVGRSVRRGVLASRPIATQSPARSRSGRVSKRGKNAARKRQMRVQHGRTVLLGELRRSNFFNELGLPRTKPEDALEEALTRAVIYARHASAQVEGLKPEDHWVRRDYDEDAGTWNMVPHVWVAAEAQAWERVAHLAGRMVQLGLEERNAAARERASEAFGLALEVVVSKLGLTDEQRALLPDAVRAELPAILEGTSRDSE